MNFIKLKYFIVVAECKSFTKAAVQCHVAQPAISQQIISLENELGFQLIDRSKNKFELTIAGKVFYQDAQAILNEFETAVKKGQNISSSSYGTLTIGIVGWDENILFHNLLHRFKTQYPNIEINFKRVALSNIEEDLLNRKYDCTFAMPYDFYDSSVIRELPFAKIKAHALISSHNPLSAKKTISRKALASECNIIFEPKGSEKTRAHLMSIYKQGGETPHNIKYVSDKQMMDILLCYDNAVAIVPEIFTGNPRLGIMELPISGPPHFIDISLLYNAEIKNQELLYFIQEAQLEGMTTKNSD